MNNPSPSQMKWSDAVKILHGSVPFSVSPPKEEATLEEHSESFTSISAIKRYMQHHEVHTEMGEFLPDEKAREMGNESTWSD